MVVVKLAGGLGNQMFEYAAAKALALHHNCEIKADLSFLLDNYDGGLRLLQQHIRTSGSLVHLLILQRP